MNRRRFIKTATGLLVPASFAQARGLRCSTTNRFEASITPRSFPALSAWWKADSFSLSDGTAIGDVGVEWLDQSGNGRHGSQSTAANRPLFKTNIFGSLPAIKFDATNDQLSVASPLTILGSGNFTFCIVYKQTVATDCNFIGNTTDNVQLRRYQSGANTCSMYFGIASATSAVFSNVPTVAGMVTYRRRASDSTTSFFENTTERGGTGPGTWGTINGVFTINAIGRTSYGGYYEGYIAEMCLYSQPMTNTDIASLYTNYMQSRWGLP